MTVLTAIAVLSAIIWVYLLAARGGYWRGSIAAALPPPTEWPEVVAVVPARNEAESIGTAIHSLIRQDYPGPFHVVLVDDHSDDGTDAVAGEAASRSGRGDRLTIVKARDLPSGWTGKLWAVSEGIAEGERRHPAQRYVWLTDADIEHAPGQLADLVARAEADRLDLVSLMVRLHCGSLAERALVPAFVYFFQMLYPFAWVNRAERRTAAAAGGCMLLRLDALGRIGGIASIRGALIDDCALAQAVKEQGRIWLGLARDTLSLRVYPAFGDIERMVARSAYTQLRHSPLLLAVAVAGLTIVFLAPPALALAGALLGGAPVLALGLGAWAMMTVSFVPSLRYYRLSLLWAPMLPAIASFYLLATVHSALQHWLGRGGMWKGRVQGGGPA